MSVVLTPEKGYDVYTGFWVDWSNGRVQGSTLTLTREGGGLLAAFLALFVSATGKSFWRIACFSFHRWFTSHNDADAHAQDGLYHQRQALVRNADSPLGALFALLNASRVWRKRTRRPFRRLFPVALSALIIYGGFAVAGIFSSKVITKTANEVLLRGKACGILDITVPAGAAVSLLDAYVGQRITAYLDYALQCYSSNASDTEACQPFVRPNLPYTTIKNASCPFADEMCILKSGNLILDTGFLDSHRDFGLNAPQSNRFLYREIQHCAPLTTRGEFSELHNDSKIPVPLMRYYYGNFTSMTPPNDKAIQDRSFTYQVPVNISARSFDNYTTMQSPSADYTVGITVWYGSNTKSTQFEPINQLHSLNADEYLLFLSSPGISYTEESDDPWYTVHTKTGVLYMGSGSSRTSKPTYVQDQPAGVLGCTVRYQFCNPNLPRSSQCEAFDGNDRTLFNKNTTIWRTAEEQETITWAKRILCGSYTPSGIDGIFDSAKAAALSSRYTLINGIQNALPAHQWQLDIEHVFGASLASLQAAFIETITGPSAQNLRQYAQPPNDTSSHQMCNNQKIVSSSYYSFSVLGLVIILALGGCIIILEYTLEPLIAWLEKCKGRKPTYASLEWQTNATFQLQRLAHEELGLGSWSRNTKDIPTTEMGEHLGILDISDEKHPFLVRPADPQSNPHTFQTYEITEMYPKPPDKVDSMSLNAQLTSAHIEQTAINSSGSISGSAPGDQASYQNPEGNAVPGHHNPSGIDAGVENGLGHVDQSLVRNQED